LTDDEQGIIRTGGANPPIKGATIANRRYRGEINIEVFRGANRETLSRLSDVLADMAGRSKRSAA